MTESERRLVCQALSIVASRYLEFAQDAEALPGGDQLAEQYHRRAIQARKWAILFADGENISISGIGSVEEAHERARRSVAEEEVGDVS
jgi:hypothetical protein